MKRRDAMKLLNETFFEFKLDKQYRLSLPVEVCKLYGVDSNKVYCKLTTIEGQKYLEICGNELDFYHLILKTDDKKRFIIPSPVRKKLGIAGGTELIGFELEKNPKKRSLLLKVKD